MGLAQGIILFFGVPMLLNFGDVVTIVFGIPAMGIVAIPIIAIMAHHRRKMEELKVQKQRLMNEDIQMQFNVLRAEIQSLRDTTMQYDLSFDSALHRVENRLQHLERPTINHGTDTTQQNTLYGGRG